MMSSLAPASKEGAYQRPESQFRDRVFADIAITKEAKFPTATFPANTHRYRLYIGSSCPWAHRAAIVRVLKGLEDAISLEVAIADASQGGWVLHNDSEGCRTLADLYQLAEPGYAGRATVPVLWDGQQRAIVNNESADIIEILNEVFDDFAHHPELDLYPADLKEDCDRWNASIYAAINNGVYRCGFAQTQTAYDDASRELFDTLTLIDRHLASYRYLFGDRLTLADVRLFTTLIRFDSVYHSLFKCNLKRIRDYEHLWGYVRDIYQMPGIAATCDLDSLKQEYFTSLFPLNPGGIVPCGPELSDLSLPHQREAIALIK